MFCRKCGVQVSANDKKCPSCGESLIPIESVQTTAAPEKPPKKGKGLVVIIVVLAIVLVASAAVLGIYIYNNSRTDAGDMGSISVASEEATENDEPEEIEKEEEKEKINKTDSKGKKQREFLDAADEISAYEDDARESAETQQEINAAAYDIYTKWDNLLNEVYQYLKSTLSKEEFEKLRKDELEWIKEKEAAMDEAASKWEGGTGEPMAYYGEGAALTRERCYELIYMIK